MSDGKSFDRWRPHPWHGLSSGDQPPFLLDAYVEITPFDTFKYEIDKASGYLRLDRPQRGASLPPALYGFVPRTLSGDSVARLTPTADKGDGDPLDICILAERPITRAEVLLKVTVIGGIRTIDNGAADDKIVATLRNDAVWGGAIDIGDIPGALVERLRHYFSTYKLSISDRDSPVATELYGREEAGAVVNAALADYAHVFGNA